MPRKSTEVARARPVRSYVAFVRNVMVGRGGLTATVLLDAFSRCGAETARSFMATGNVILQTARDPEQLAMDASQTLGEPVFIRGLAELARLEAGRPFDATPSGYHERLVTFFPTGLRVVPRAPLRGQRGDFEIFAVGTREAFAFTRLVGGRPGNPTRVLEQLLGVKVTTRNWNTVVRSLTVCREQQARTPGIT